MTRSVAAVAAALPLVLSACGGSRETSTIVASGHVEATDVRISTKVAGRLERFALEEGDVVRVGQELGSIDTTDLAGQRIVRDAIKRLGFKAHPSVCLAAPLLDPGGGSPTFFHPARPRSHFFSLQQG